MVALIIILVLGILMSAVFIVSKVTNYSLKTIIFKTLASLFFMALAITALCLSGTNHLTFKVLAVVGLFFGLLGDVFLGYKYINKGKMQKLFILLGMFAFAFGHISYVLALLIEFYIPGNALYMVIPFVLPIVIVSCYMVISRKAGVILEGGMIYFGLFYLYCLTMMFSSALSMVCLYKFESTTLVMFFIGAICFVSSDFMLTGNYFKKGDRSKAYKAIYSVFYYAAQFLIAFSIFFLV